MSDSTNPTDQVTAYAGALAKLEQTKKHMEAMAEVVRQASAILYQWRTIKVTHVAGANSLPGVRPTGTIDGARWPTAEQLAGGITAYYQALQEARDAHEAIPQAARGAVMAPVP